MHPVNRVARAFRASSSPRTPCFTASLAAAAAEMESPGGAAVEGAESNGWRLPVGFLVGDFFCPVDKSALRGRVLLLNGTLAQGDHECANCKWLEHQLVRFNRIQMQDVESVLNEGISPMSRARLCDILPAVVEGELLGEDCRCELERAKRMSEGRGHFDWPSATREMILLRVLGEKFRNSDDGKRVETDLMRWAELKFPGKFSRFGFKFFPAVNELIREKRCAGERDPLERDRLLRDLLEVTKSFKPEDFDITSLSWGPSIGEQYFRLCRNIVQWNVDTFHPEVKGKADEIKYLANNGAFICDGVDIGALVIQVLIKNLENMKTVLTHT